MNAEQKRTWNDFLKLFPDDKHCLEKIVSCLKKTGWRFSCRRCGSEVLSRRFGERRYFCQDCNYRGWILAGTFFEFIRKSQLWLGATWFFEKGIPINAWQFHELAKCAYSTALMIFRKLASVLYENLEAVESTDSIDSANFVSLYWKRSNQTPKGEHPNMEQIYFEQSDDFMKDGDSSNLALKNSESSDFKQFDLKPCDLNSAELQNDESKETVNLSAEESAILKLLSYEKIHFDHICTRSGFMPGVVVASLTCLELKYLVEQHSGDYFTLKSKPLRSRQQSKFDSLIDIPIEKIESFLQFIKSHIHGVSRKYLQFYLAIYWCMQDRHRWYLDQLLEACCKSNFKSSRLLFEYVTPSQVLMI